MLSFGKNRRMLSVSRMVTVDLALLEGHLMKVANTVDLKPAFSF